MDLQQYDRLKTELGDIVRGAVLRGGLDRLQQNVRDLFGRLAEDRFNLVVVGRFSRGKSSLMNAMLGADRLPTGIVPVTSVITTVSYGTEEQVVLYYQHTSLFMEIPISQLAEHITERGNPGNMRRIRTAEVQLPAELLRRGFHFIDTPGLGSSIVENTRTTEAFLPEADAFVLVTSYDSPLSEEEQRVLQMVQRSGRRLFLVVNKQDCADATQRQQVLEHLASQLAGIFGNDPPPVFSVSAQQGLAARMHGDSAQLAASGLPAFETALLDFLINEKRREFLLSMIGRIGALVGDQAGTEQDHARLGTLRTEIESAQPTPAPTEAIASRAQISSTLPSCEICAGVIGALFDFLAEYQYRLSGDREVQAELAERHGLCGPHTWLFETIAAPKEICTGFAGVAERQAATLRATAQGKPAGALACQAIEAALPNRRSCAACEVGRRAARDAVDAAATRLRRDMTAALPELSAICVPHLRLLVAALGDSALVQTVLLRQADLLDRLAEDMRHFVLKRDGLQRHLTTKEEVAAAERALRVLLGHPTAQMGPEPMQSDQAAAWVRRAGEPERIAPGAPAQACSPVVTALSNGRG